MTKAQEIYERVEALVAGKPAAGRERLRVLGAPVRPVHQDGVREPVRDRAEAG